MRVKILGRQNQDLLVGADEQNASSFVAPIGSRASFPSWDSGRESQKEPNGFEHEMNTSNPHGKVFSSVVQKFPCPRPSF
jgi:hypothetical protein